VITIDETYLEETLLQLLAIPSPVGLTDEVVRYTAQRFSALGIPYELTRRGAIRATLTGKARKPARAVVAHLDTLGAMVRALKPNGRLAIVPIGHWSARFSEGARVTIFTDDGRQFRGTCLPLKTSGHAFGPEIDSQPVGWEQVEVRVDIPAEDGKAFEAAGIQVGDWIAFDPQTEVTPTGYYVSRYLDDKAAVAALLTACKARSMASHGKSSPKSCRCRTIRCRNRKSFWAFDTFPLHFRKTVVTIACDDSL